ncbi:hypothetical protein C8Q79DRAFT_521282 [Trametes meyenii]|nr:hypothetical protein C8Q79DRAFT_521282 [Trametes meyenii]
MGETILPSRVSVGICAHTLEIRFSHCIPVVAGTKLPSVAAVFGGPMLESPCSSRVGTMDESAALLVESTPCSPSPSLPRTLTRLAKKRPSPLQPAQSVEVSQHADAEAVTPTPTPTTPSALVRAFGAMIKSRFL